MQNASIKAFNPLPIRILTRETTGAKRLARFLYIFAPEDA
jgi:hypothetical protein